MRQMFSACSWKNLGLLPLPYKAFFAGMVALITFVLLLWLTIWPMAEAIDQARGQEKQWQQLLIRKARMVREAPAYQEALLKAGQYWQQLQDKLPSDNEMPKLLDDISISGVSLGLHFQAFIPLPLQLENQLVVRSIKVVVLGDYTQLARFLSRLAHLPQLVTVGSAIFEAKAASGSTIQLTLLLYTYQYQTGTG